LLLNVLPSDIAEELKKTGKVEPRAFRDTTVVFTDFVDFTAIAESLSAAELVRELDLCFREFDNIIHERSIEKLRPSAIAIFCSRIRRSCTHINRASWPPSNAPVHEIGMEARTRAGKPTWEMRLASHWPGDRRRDPAIKSLPTTLRATL
jgi:class 3 adenylate cyclase